jgi:hypothetical protein
MVVLSRKTLREWGAVSGGRTHPLLLACFLLPAPCSRFPPKLRIFEIPSRSQYGADDGARIPTAEEKALYFGAFRGTGQGAGTQAAALQKRPEGRQFLSVRAYGAGGPGSARGQLGADIGRSVALLKRLPGELADEPGVVQDTPPGQVVEDSFHVSGCVAPLEDLAAQLLPAVVPDREEALRARTRVGNIR